MYAKDISDIPDFNNKFENNQLLITDIFDGDVVEVVNLIKNMIKGRKDNNYGAKLFLNSNYDEFLEEHEGVKNLDFETYTKLKGIQTIDINLGYYAILINFCFHQYGSCGWYVNLQDGSSSNYTNIDDLLTTPIIGTTTD